MKVLAVFLSLLVLAASQTCVKIPANQQSTACHGPASVCSNDGDAEIDFALYTDDYMSKAKEEWGMCAVT